jgi:hypothetical protein
MKTNPHITITGSVTKFDQEERSFTMNPTQYVILTHATAPFPIHANFADSGSRKRWGAEGPKVAIGSSVTIGGSLQRIVREHDIDRTFQFAQVEVANIAYLGTTRTNLPTSLTRTFLSSHLTRHIIFYPKIDDGSPKNRKRWNWDDLQKASHDPHPSPGPSSTRSQGKRKRTDDEYDSEQEVEKKMEDEKNINHTPPKN